MFRSDVCFIRVAVEDERSMPSSAEYFGIPLGEQHRRHDYERVWQEIGEAHTDHHDGFTQPHLVTNEAAFNR